MASYLHTAIIFAVGVTFLFKVYASSDDLVGSPSKVYKALEAVSSSTRDCSAIPAKQNCGPVKDNQGGSFLTMLSKGGIIFGIINIVGNFGTVFVDQSYWQSAIAAKPSSSTKGYLLGGLVWFTIPFALATAMGLATVAMDLPVTSASRRRFGPAGRRRSFFGKGSQMITIMLFMAITSPVPRNKSPSLP